MSNDFYFVTSTILKQVSIFTSRAYFDIMLKSLNFCVQHKNLDIYSWIIMPDFFQLVCQTPELSKTMQSLKRHTARQIIQQLEAENKKWILNLFEYYKKRHKTQSYLQIWEEGFDPQIIRDDMMLAQTVKQIHRHPVEAGFVRKPEQWRHSSAAFFQGSASLVRTSLLPSQVKPGFTC